MWTMNLFVCVIIASDITMSYLTLPLSGIILVILHKNHSFSGAFFTISSLLQGEFLILIYLSLNSVNFVITGRAHVWPCLDLNYKLILCNSHSRSATKWRIYGVAVLSKSSFITIMTFIFWIMFVVRLLRHSFYARLSGRYKSHFMPEQVDCCTFTCKIFLLSIFGIFVFHFHLHLFASLGKQIHASWLFWFNFWM